MHAYDCFRHFPNIYVIECLVVSPHHFGQAVGCLQVATSRALAPGFARGTIESCCRDIATLPGVRGQGAGNQVLRVGLGERDARRHGNPSRCRRGFFSPVCADALRSFIRGMGGLPCWDDTDAVVLQPPEWQPENVGRWSIPKPTHPLAQRETYDLIGDGTERSFPRFVPRHFPCRCGKSRLIPSYVRVVTVRVAILGRTPAVASLVGQSTQANSRGGVTPPCRVAGARSGTRIGEPRKDSRG